MAPPPAARGRDGQTEPGGAARGAGPRYLVMLDMNGTLCYRSDEPVPAARGSQKANVDLYVRHKFFYGRKGIVDFVDKLYDSDAFYLVPYSSMIQDSSQAGVWARFPPGMRAMFPPTSITHFHSFLQGDMSKPDPDMDKPDPEWDTVRDMDKVWRELPGFGPERTLLLDSDARKFRETPRNGIVVPEYGEREVKMQDYTTLDDLLAYLLLIADSQPKDVRDYLEAHPFEEYRKLRAASRDKATGAVSEGHVTGLEQPEQ